jgi:membrane-associated phospholipid phosphatase
VPRSRLTTTALVCLAATAASSLAVAHGSGPYGFEDPALDWLARPSLVRPWAHLTELLAAPAIFAVLVVCFALGRAKRAFARVAVYAMFALVALLVSEHVVKPLVQRTYYGEPSFPSGNVTAVSATAIAMWLALYPVLGKRARHMTLAIGVAWVLLTSLSVVGALWHTPLDAVGSVLLSVGIVTAGAAVFESVRGPVTRGPVARGPVTRGPVTRGPVTRGAGREAHSVETGRAGGRERSRVVPPRRCECVGEPRVRIRPVAAISDASPQFGVCNVPES